MAAEGMNSSPACWREATVCPMFRIIHVPTALGGVFPPVEEHCHLNHFCSFRLRVTAVACRCSRRNVANLYRYLDAANHRGRFNTFFVVEWWDPAAALRQKACELLLALQPQLGDTSVLIIEDSMKAKRGSHMDAVAKMKAPVIDGYIRGHRDVCAVLATVTMSSLWASDSPSRKRTGRLWGLPFARPRSWRRT
jgi:hypothetical protein